MKKQLKGGMKKMKSKKLIAFLALGFIVLGIFLVAASLVNSQAANIKKVQNQESNMTYSNIIGRFIIWTDDGNHVMWGTYSLYRNTYCYNDSSFNNFNGCVIGNFKAQDSDGRISSGTLTRNQFKGSYCYKLNTDVSNCQIFYIKYYGNKWTGSGVFGLEKSQGELRMFKNLEGHIVM